MMYPGDNQANGMSFDDAIREYGDYLSAMRQYYPNVKFFYITNFPNHGWKGAPAYMKQDTNTEGKK